MQRSNGLGDLDADAMYSMGRRHCVRHIHRCAGLLKRYGILGAAMCCGRCARRTPRTAPRRTLSHPQAALALGAAFALSAMLTAAPAKADIVSAAGAMLRARRQQRTPWRAADRPPAAAGARFCIITSMPGSWQFWTRQLVGWLWPQRNFAAHPRGSCSPGPTIALPNALAQLKTRCLQTSDLLAKSAANKELNDKKRIATSSANVARSRTVTDGTCA